MPQLGARVRIIPSAAKQILSHSDILNEEVIVSAVLSIPERKREYYDSNRFTITFRRRTSSGIWKAVLLRVEKTEPFQVNDAQQLDEIEYVVLVVHVEST